jgi:hypothetical protein
MASATDPVLFRSDAWQLQQANYPANPVEALTYVIHAAGTNDLKKFLSIFQWDKKLFDRLFPKNGKDNNSACDQLIALKAKGVFEIAGIEIVQVEDEDIVDCGAKALKIKLSLKDSELFIDLPEGYWDYAEECVVERSLAVNDPDDGLEEPNLEELEKE